MDNWQQFQVSSVNDCSEYNYLCSAGGGEITFNFKYVTSDNSKKKV